MRLKMKILCISVLVIVVNLLTIEAQQSYVNNRQLDCYNHYNVTDGFPCNAARPSCLSYLTFRPIHPYDTPATIAYLLSSDAAAIASANNFSSDVDTIPADQRIIVVPVNCTCGSNRYQHHGASYKLKTSSETYFSVANNTYQGLTTCQALMAANPEHESRNLSVGLTIRVPLRCACPTPGQVASGVRFLLSYLVAFRDDISSIASRFRLQDPQAVLDANRLTSADIIFPFTDLLVPLEAPPQADWLLSDNNTPDPPPPPPPTVAAPPPSSGHTTKWIIIGVASGAVLLLIVLGLALVFFCFFRRRRSKATASASAVVLPPTKTDRTRSNQTYSPVLETDSSSWSHSGQGFRSAVDSLTIYTIEELNAATDFFSKDNQIRGAVFHGSFKGDIAAVKVMKGEVSAEINILKHINHSNIIRLSGFCVHSGNTYLVYEYADRGSLSDCLLSKSQSPLGWKQRVEIAHGVADALNYLHNFADPPYIHKNLKSSNILLDAKLRAKLSNFGLARSLGQNPNDDHKDEGLHLTRHIVGTQGYLAPEYIENGLITPKLDVFAFGVVLLELLSGREATATKNSTTGAREELLSDSIRRVMEGDNVRQKLQGFIDPSLKQEYPLDLAFSFAQLANICVSLDLNARPNITQVFVTLSKIWSSSSDWDPSDELDNSRSLSLVR